MPTFSECPGYGLVRGGVQGDTIHYTHVNELRIANYLDPAGLAHQDLFLKLGKDFDDIRFVHMKFQQVSELTLGRADLLAGLRLLRRDAAGVEVAAADPSRFRVVAERVEFIE